jgi:tRNA(Ile)-lysidine synthase
LRLEVVHVHHGLRAEADADQEVVRALAERLGLPCHLERVTVRSAPGWEGLEAEARRVRHAALDAVARRIGASRIAVGHTADDQAETVLMRLLGGAGPRGLAGMAPTHGLLIRPLIESRRADILAHVMARHLPWVEDLSNRDPRFLRNRLRHEVLPTLAGVAGPRITEALCRSAALCRALVEDLDRRARAEAERLGRSEPAGLVFALADLRALSLDVGAATLLQAAALLGDARPRREAVHRGVRRLLEAAPPRRALSLGRLVIERSGRWLRVGPARLPALAPRVWGIPGELALDEVGVRLEARCFERGPDYAPPRERHRAAFDADRIGRLVVRARRRGERFLPFGASGPRRLKSLLADEGIPRWQRARVPLLEADGVVAWVAGVRRAQVALIGAETRRILEVTLYLL